MKWNFISKQLIQISILFDLITLHPLDGIACQKSLPGRELGLYTASVPTSGDWNVSFHAGHQPASYLLKGFGPELQTEVMMQVLATKHVLVA